MFRKRSLDESRIIRRVLRGHTDEFGQLVEAYLPVVHAVAFALLGSHADAEDAAQESFIRAYRSLDTLRDRDRFGAWLMQIARNTCLTHMKMRNREEKRIERAHASVPEAQPPDVASHEVQEMVQRAMSEVGDDVREVLMLHYFAEKETAEIAELLGISTDAVRKRLQRARDVLRDRLESEIGPALRKQRPGKGRVDTVIGVVIASQPAWYTAPTIVSRIVEGLLNVMGGSAIMKTALVAAVIAIGMYAGFGTTRISVKDSTPSQAETVVVLPSPNQDQAGKDTAEPESTVGAIAQLQAQEVVPKIESQNKVIKTPISQVGGNPQHTNFVDTAGIRNKPTIAWATPVGEPEYKIGSNLMLDERGYLYLNYSKTNLSKSPENENYVLCLASTGQKLWISDPIKKSRWSKSAPAIAGNGDLIYGHADGAVRAYDRDNGLGKWESFISPGEEQLARGVSSSPLIDNFGDIYVGGRKYNGFFKFSSDGKMLWEVPLPQDSDHLMGSASSPALSHDGKTVYFSRGHEWNPDPSGYGLYAIDSESGLIRWRFHPDDTDIGGFGYTSPMVASDGTILIQNDASCVLYAIQDANESPHVKWTFAPAVTKDCPRLTATDGEFIYAAAIGEAVQMLFALSVDGREIWSAQFEDGYAIGSPVVTKDTVYVIVNRLGLVCLEKKTGTVLWECRVAPTDNQEGESVEVGKDGTIYWLVGGTQEYPDQPTVLALKP